MIAEYDNGAGVTSPTRKYIYNGSQMLARIDSSGTKYYLKDHLSTRVVTDSSGNVVEQHGHYPYGEVWYDGSDKWKFTTYERDAETGNDYAEARYYVNRFGRFNSTDLLSGSSDDPQSLNRYAYSRNDPVNRFDPTGMDYLEVDNTDDGNQDILGDIGVEGLLPITVPDSLIQSLQQLPPYIPSVDTQITVTAAPPDPVDLSYAPLGAGALAQQDFGISLPLPPGVARALTTLKKAIANDPNCEKFLGPGVGQQIDGMLQNASGSVVGTTTIPPPGGVMINAASNGYIVGQSTTLNSIGAFYSGAYNGAPLTTDLGRMPGGTPAAQGFILLHEIAHLMNDQGGAPGFGPDYSSTSTSKVNANDKLLNKNCDKTIRGL